MENLTTKVTEEDLNNGLNDKFGVVYSRDGKRLLKCEKRGIVDYEVKKGTEIICDSAFDWDRTLETISLPDSVVSIGKNAFANCDSLQQVNLSKNLVTIGDGAFCWCSSLKEMILPNSVVEIGNFSFKLCESMKRLVISNSVKIIGYETFSDCYSLQEIVIPNSVKRLELHAFYSCEELQQITIPNSVTYIGTEALGWCDLQQIVFEGIVKHIEDDAFDNNPIKRIIIPIETTKHFQKILPPNLCKKIYGVERTSDYKNDLP
ncbi:MAG: leucine-rich repeat domain-containing protein [Bacteroidales bacterium]|nr:leucine-rich repeat domain-containing protein [Bacteroidales bacterium]